jgi:hypothetical protein
MNRPQLNDSQPMIELTVRHMERSIIQTLNPVLMQEEISNAVAAVCTPENIRTQLTQAIDSALKKVVATAVDNAIARSEELTKYIRLRAEQEVSERMRAQVGYLEKYGDGA